ncbi:MAG: MFS transporter, partial [Firmicutes bacterium]|nr:MFS transporter [Bacillota bacterium]
SLIPIITRKLSVTAALMILGINTVLWTAFFLWKLPTHSLYRPQTVGRGDIIHVIHRLKRPLWLSALLSPAQYGLLTYTLMDLHTRWHTTDRIAGLLLALGLSGGLMTRILFGYLSDRHGHRAHLLSLMAGFGAVFLSLWAVIPLATPVGIIAVLFFFMGAAIDGWNAVLSAWTMRQASPGEAGLAFAIVGVAGFIGIAVILPILGWAIQQSGSYRAAWIILAILYFIGTFVAHQRPAHLASSVG